jgi:hypothetical protein
MIPYYIVFLLEGNCFIGKNCGFQQTLSIFRKTFVREDHIMIIPRRTNGSRKTIDILLYEELELKPIERFVLSICKMDWISWRIKERPLSQSYLCYLSILNFFLGFHCKELAGMLVCNKI